LDSALIGIACREPLAVPLEGRENVSISTLLTGLPRRRVCLGKTRGGGLACDLGTGHPGWRKGYWHWRATGIRRRLRFELPGAPIPNSGSSSAVGRALVIVLWPALNPIAKFGKGK